MAWICAVLVLVVTSLSAYMRLSKAGNGCEPWPQCYGQTLRALQQGQAPVLDAAADTAAARLAHRVVATLALLLVILMTMTALMARPALWREGRMVLGLLALVLFLAVLGRWTAQARVPAVTLGNLLAGFVMVALSVRLARTAGRDAAGTAPAQRRLARWAALGAALLLLNIALGGLLSAGFFGLSCPELAGCDVSGASWQALNPWREPLFDLAQPSNPAGAWVGVLHRVGALAVACVLVPLAVAAWRTGRRFAAALLLLLLAAQGVLGAVLVVSALPLPVALAHNVLAALLLTVTLGLADGAGRTGPAHPI
jgi:cytochrome c oxidase assembly protein subunit 15